MQTARKRKPRKSKVIPLYKRKKKTVAKKKKGTKKPVTRRKKATLKKPVFLKYPKKPLASATVTQKDNWLKRCADIDKRNQKKLTEYKQKITKKKTVDKKFTNFKPKKFSI